MKDFFKRIYHILRAFALIFLVSTMLMTLFYRFIPPVFTPLMLIRCVQQVFDGKLPVLKKDWTSIESISPNMVQAVVASEDNNFMSHWGFDFKAIQKAQKMNKKGRKLRGASTITQQTAKNVFLWPQRSYIRKGLEVYFTVLIELMWSKERIMEVYLNVIEMGPGIYGSQAAAEKYFKKDASKLTRSDAALIAAIIPNPRKWKPNQPTSYILRRKAWILRNMQNLGPVKFD